jgi:hypothetical protein
MRGVELLALKKRQKSLIYLKSTTKASKIIPIAPSSVPGGLPWSKEVRNVNNTTFIELINRNFQ